MSAFVNPILPKDAQEAPPREESRKRPFIRLARFEDYDQIAAVESRHGLTVKARDPWLALWLNNPAYLELGDWPIGWVIEDGDGQIVGSLGNVPTFAYFGGKKYVSAAGRGWAVDVPFRALSVMLLARQLKQTGADINVIATPSSTTAALCTQLGWSRAPVGKWDRSQFWIASYAAGLQGYLDAKLSKSFSRTFGAILSPPLRLKDSLSERQPMKSDYSFDWQPCFDCRFDGMWEELKETRPGLLLGSRDLETLNWHFQHSLQQRRTWILTASQDSRLVGYAVFERREIQSLGLERALIIDFQTLVKDPDLSCAMIDHALARCRREGVHVLENMGCWLEKLQPVRRPPHNRSLESWCYLYRVTNPELDRSLQNASCWYPTQYDGDASL